jgi:hypothetical protein
LRAGAKMASVVTIIIEKTMKKIFKKKIITNLPTLIFSRYETGTTGILFLYLIQLTGLMFGLAHMLALNNTMHLTFHN